MQLILCFETANAYSLSPDFLLSSTVPSVSTNRTAPKPPNKAIFFSNTFYNIFYFSHAWRRKRDGNVAQTTLLAGCAKRLKSPPQVRIKSGLLVALLGAFIYAAIGATHNRETERKDLEFVGF